MVGGFGMRGGYGGMQNPGMPQMAYGHPQQGYPMAAHPQMYAQQQQYGRGGYPPQAAAMNYGAIPQQGKSALVTYRSNFSRTIYVARGRC